MLTDSGRARLEPVLAFLVVTGLGIAVWLAFAAIFQMSLADDEAWILLGIQSLATRGVYGLSLGAAPTTTGGIHTLAEVGLYRLAGNTLPVLRLFPLACFVLLLWSFYAWSRRADSSRIAGLAACCLLVAVPGTLNLSGSAFGAVPATLLVVWGIRLWTPRDGTRAGHLLAGAVFGLAAATRVQCVLVLPALLAAAALAPRDRRTHFIAAALACASGLTVFVLGYGGLVALTPEALDSLWVTGQATGLQNSALGAPQALRNWVVASGFAPFPLLVAATGVALWSSREDGVRADQQRVCLWFGWLVWTAWVAFAPFAHLRYLWPALACFALALGPALASLYDRRPGRARLAALLIALACLTSGCVTTLRNLTLGDLNILHWEWREKTAIQFPRMGSALHQRQMADYLRRLPARRRLVVLSFGLELEFLSGRVLIPIERFIRMGGMGELDPRRIPRWIVTTPHLGNRVHLAPRAQMWLDESCVLEVRFGEYALFRVRGQYPSDLSLLRPQPEPVRP